MKEFLSSDRWVEGISQTLSKAAHEVNAVAMSKYMKDNFTFFGIKSPERKSLTASYLRKHAFPDADLAEVISLLWKKDEREMQYIGIELLTRKIKKQDAAFIQLIEWLIIHKSWWDTVDFLGPLAGTLFLQHPTLQPTTTNRWIHSENMWLNRAALLFQLKYRDQTDFKLLTAYILTVVDSQEFFIRKAIGWSLRQYSKFEPKLVEDFIMKYENRLSGLSIREGLKHINRKRKA